MSLPTSLPICVKLPGARLLSSRQEGALPTAQAGFLETCSMNSHLPFLHFLSQPSLLVLPSLPPKRLTQVSLGQRKKPSLTLLSLAKRPLLPFALTSLKRQPMPSLLRTYPLPSYSGKHSFQRSSLRPTHNQRLVSVFTLLSLHTTPSIMGRLVSPQN